MYSPHREGKVSAETERMKNIKADFLKRKY
jgi:hypothetical protein